MSVYPAPNAPGATRAPRSPNFAITGALRPAEDTTRIVDLVAVALPKSLVPYIIPNTRNAPTSTRPAKPTEKIARKTTF